MKILYYDCFAGISGDMNLGALIDAGVPAEYLLTELKKLNVEGWEITVESGLKMGISGTRVNVKLKHTHGHGHGHGHHHSHGHHHEPHRNLEDITKIINESSLNDFVKSKSLKMFTEIARAEAKIHAKSINEIHFHEVGAIDSIVDSVGAAICIDYLKPDKIMSSTVELGGGFVNCAHGKFPVPAPATAEILKDIPVKKGAADKETTTPTGAAILKTFVDEFTDTTSFSIEKSAYGLGHRDLEIPNVLRVFLGEKVVGGKLEEVKAIMLEANIDDMNPEYYDYIMQKLFDEGAHDVFMVPIIMKKSRPAIQLKVLCNRQELETMKELILRETTSLGLRYYEVDKSMLGREVETLSTKYGEIRIKYGIHNGKALKHKAEYEDCILAAKEHSVSLKEIYTEIERLLNK